MGGTLSVVFANIFMTKMEKDIVEPSKPEFYRRFVDDSINKRKKNTLDELISEIQFTIEISPPKFLDTQILYCDTTIESSVHWGKTKYQFIGALQYPRSTNETQSTQICTEHRESPQTLIMKK